MMKLQSDILTVAQLSGGDIQDMFALMQASYHNVYWEVFKRDLAAKDWVIVIRDPGKQRIKGFSTLQVFLQDFQGQTCQVAFSGDTIIAPDCWGSLRLPVAFGTLMLSIKNADPSVPLYWMLITKGIRTYRVLPVFFKRFYPRYDQTTPEHMRRFMQVLGERKYPQHYQTSGIIAAEASGQCLRRELSGEDGVLARQDPHVQFFLEQNPGHGQGDELLCLAEFSWENLCPYIIRQLRRSGPLELVRKIQTLSGSL
jgi:hypothetical protein